MKKFLFAICLALLTTPSLWAYDFEVNGIYYNITDFGKSVSVTYKNTDYNSYSGNVVIPSTVTYNSTTYSVIYIGEFAFSDCTGLTAVTIPNSVIFIDRNAFMNCNGLTSITIPNSVISIDRNAFMNCNGLTSITIPESVTSIGGSAFEGTPWYNNQPDGVIYAGAILYKYKGTMPAGTNIAVKEGTISISGDAFHACTGLTSITIPNSVTSIGNSAFYCCTGLTSITIPNSVTSIGSSAFSRCTGLTAVTIPNSVISIDRNAFMNCNGLTSITIPEGVTSIGDGAFYGCTGLTSITIPNSVTSIGGSAFSGTPWYNNQPDGVIYAGAILYKYKGTMPAGTNIAVKEGTISISDYAFSGCTGLTSITRGCVKIQLDTPSI